MSVFAALMSGKGTGAISTIEVFGDGGADVIEKIFEPAGNKPASFEQGRILLGKIKKAGETIDQVTIGCEGQKSFCVHCHGNPLIVADIMAMLKQAGAKLVTTEQLLAKSISAKGDINTIALEAKVSQSSAKTLEGAKIIANQIETGLSEKAGKWLGEMEAISLDQIIADAERILQSSRLAKLIIYGCTAVITGPPNSGKSTLLNCLCGREKAIVTDIKGTTRDWVSAECKIGPVFVELIDTAGLDEKTVEKDFVERASQKKAIEVLQRADLVLFVIDNSRTRDQIDGLIERIANKKVVAVLNKCDLSAKFEAGKMSKTLGQAVKISAKLGMGIEGLLKRIARELGAVDFDLKQPVCITSRQEDLLKKLKNAESKAEAVSVITELLNGRFCV